jgi:hypothetical protein
VREDPKHRGLLFAGSEQQVYVSFDDGDRWQSLRLNMAASSIRDLIIKDDDVVVATHGRGFWILDDIEPLRQATSTSADVLFKPAPTWRFRWNKNTDTPLPPDEPAGQNPPDGAIIDYTLNASSPATLEILDSAGNIVRRYSSADRVEPPKDEGQVPWYWIRPPRALSGEAGMHRFVWDLHYTPVPGLERSYPIAAIDRDTAPTPTSPWIMPGLYTVRLTANGRSMTQPLTVKMDPRVKTSPAGLQQQFDLSMSVYNRMMEMATALQELRGYRTRLKDSPALADLARRAAALESVESDDSGNPPETFGRLRGSLSSLLSLLQGADEAPTTQAAAAVADRLQASDALMQRWAALRTELQGAVKEPLIRRLAAPSPRLRGEGSRAPSPACGRGAQRRVRADHSRPHPRIGRPLGHGIDHAGLRCAEAADGALVHPDDRVDLTDRLHRAPLQRMDEVMVKPLADGRDVAERRPDARIVEDLPRRGDHRAKLPVQRGATRLCVAVVVVDHADRIVQRRPRLSADQLLLRVGEHSQHRGQLAHLSEHELHVALLRPDHLLRIEDVAGRLGHRRSRENCACQQAMSDFHNSSDVKFLLQD